ncbi:MAG: cupin domain-containing protein [Halodesulfurarchaeum sp.]|nr:cupin domain-containing protein [Halodesulfurarchaeum sp.]
MAKDYQILEPDSIPETPFPESGVTHRKLTGELRAQEMRVNQVTVDPGEVVGYHSHKRQEEIYVCHKGPGEVYVDGEHLEVPEGGIVRIGVDVPRQVLNTGDFPTVWIMFGAPPIGTREDYGEYEVSDGGYGEEP